MKYQIKEKFLESVSGDPSWLIPHYEFQHVGAIETDTIIQKGDYVNNQRVIDIMHENGQSVLIVSKKEF